MEQLGLQSPDLKEKLLNQTSLDMELEDYLNQDANFIKT